MKQHLKRYGYPLLALILLILFLLCHWQSEPLTTAPPPPDTPGTWVLVDTVSGGKEALDWDMTWEEDFSFSNDVPHFNSGDGNYRIEFEHWWDETFDGWCTFPCPASTVWKVYDSNGFLVHSLSERNPTNTFGNPELLSGTWDGSQWKITFKNSCQCTLSYDWEINVYAYGVEE